MIDYISSKENNSIKRYKSILRNGDENYFVVEGYHLIEMAKESCFLTEVFTSEEVDYKGIKTHIIPFNLLKSMASSTNPEPILGICKKKVGEMFSSPKGLLLDRVQDPGNVGTLLRSALCFGYKDIYLLNGCASIYNPKTISSSQGAIFKLNIFSKLEGKNIIPSLKEKGYIVYASSLKNSTDFELLSSLPKKYIVCLGNEGVGMDEGNIRLCSSSLYININDMDSLNVGVAGSILMYGLNRKNK